MLSRMPGFRTTPEAARTPRAHPFAATLRIRCLALAVALTAPLASAGDTDAATLEVARSIEIAASADRVWAIVGDFGDMTYLDAVVSKTEIVRGKNNEIGAQRAISLKDGGLILETLTAWRTKPHALSYRMDDGPLPVSHYTSTIEVTPSGGASRVTWSGSFRHKAAATATAGHDDEANAAVDLIAGIYEAGLSAIKTAAEN